MHLNEVFRLFDESQRRSDRRRGVDRKRRQGEDEFGPITVTGGPCDHCGATGILTVRWRDIKLPSIEVKHTILKDKDNHLGINCGCYGKFHRQIAHIADRVEVRREN